MQGNGFLIQIADAFVYTLLMINYFRDKIAYH